jgi:cysteine desulfurase/selenocysteine lyase
MITAAKSIGAKVLIDAAQAVAHFPMEVGKLDCDWLVFSGHKLFGPTGIGVLYGKYDVLDAMEVYRTGGEMIDKVSFSGTTFQKPPLKFEAGTPHIQGIIGLGEAIRWFNGIGWEVIAQIEKAQIAWMQPVLSDLSEVRWMGQVDRKTALYSFVSNACHHGDLGMLLDQQGIAIRTGHHCTQPLWEAWGLTGSARASFALYNNEDDVDAFHVGLKKAIKMLSA